MAINSHNERAALISLALWRGRVLPRADGVIDTVDRLRLALLYPSESFQTTFFQPHFGAQVNKASGVLISPE